MGHPRGSKNCLCHWMLQPFVASKCSSSLAPCSSSNVVIVPSDPSLEEKLEPRPSDRDGTFSLKCLKSPAAEDKAVPGPSGIARGSRLDGELPAFMNTGDDWLQTDSGNERQQIPSDEEQLPPPLNPRPWTMDQRKTQGKSSRLLVRRPPCPFSEGTSGLN